MNSMPPTIEIYSSDSLEKLIQQTWEIGWAKAWVKDKNDDRFYRKTQAKTRK